MLCPALSSQESAEAARTISANGTRLRRDLSRKLRGHDRINTALCKESLALIRAGPHAGISFSRLETNLLLF